MWIICPIYRDYRYMNQPDKRPSFHTDAFMNGYYNGYDDCCRGVHYYDNDIDKGGMGNFIVEITFLDTGNNGPCFVRDYIEEYPRYSTANIDFIETMYDDDPRTLNGIYTTHIAMSSGLIENGERFHACIQDLETDKTRCYSSTNGYENEPEEITLRV